MVGKAKWIATLALVTGVALAAAAPMRAADVSHPAAAATSLDALFNKLGIPFTNSGDNWYKAVLTDEGTSTTMLFNARELGTLNDGSKLTAVVMYVPLVKMGEGATPSAAMLKKINELNGNLVMGRVAFVNGGGGVYYQGTFWLNDATEKTLSYQMLYASAMSADLAKELRPFAGS